MTLTTCATCSPISRRCRRCRAACAITTCRFRSTSAACSAAGSSCSSTASRSRPIRPSRRDWNRGAYLVNGPGHCAECHSPRNMLGGIVASQRFAGGPEPDGEGWVPNITQNGLRHVARSDIVETARRPARRPTATRSAARWARSSRNTSQAQRTPTARRWRPTSSRCRRSKGRSRRRKQVTGLRQGRVRASANRAALELPTRRMNLVKAILLKLSRRCCLR